MPAISVLMDLEAREYARQEIQDFTRVALAFGGEKKDRKQWLDPLTKAAEGEEGTGDGDDFVAKFGSGF